jgi:DNA-binding NarL/FixJ family response regulator
VELRCLIVDDSVRFLEAARALLQQQGLQVVGMATNVAQALESASALRPDVALVDVGLGDESGFDVAARIDGVLVILTSTQDEQDLADLLEASPAIGFLPKAALSAAAIGELLRRSGRQTPVSEPPGT